MARFDDLQRRARATRQRAARDHARIASGVQEHLRQFDLTSMGPSDSLFGPVRLMSQGPYRMIDDRSASLDEDDTESSDYWSDSQIQDFADAGYAFFPSLRIFTTRGQNNIERILAKNEKFKFWAYDRYAHAFSSAPSSPGLHPYSDEEYSLFANHANPYALDTAGDPAVAWDLAGPAEAYWAYPHLDLATDHAALWKQYYDAQQYKPVGLKFDYFSADAGPSVESANPLDIDQDATTFPNDSDEWALWKASQEAWVTAYRDVLGGDFPLIANGRGAQPVDSETADLRKLLNGWYAQWMGTVWFTAREVAEDWYTELVTNAGANFKRKPWNRPWVQTDVRKLHNNEGDASKMKDFARAMALIYQCIYRHREDNVSGTWRGQDAVWAGWASKGLSARGDVERTVNADTTITYTRQIDAGVATVTVDTEGNGGGVLTATVL